MASDPVIKLGPLGVRQGCGIRFQAFPERVEQFCLLHGGEALYLASQVAHMATTLARFSGSCKHEPLRDGALNPTFRKERETWGAPFSWSGRKTPTAQRRKRLAS